MHHHDPNKQPLTPLPLSPPNAHTPDMSAAIYFLIYRWTQLTVDNIMHVSRKVCAPIPPHFYHISTVETSLWLIRSARDCSQNCPLGHVAASRDTHVCQTHHSVTSHTSMLVDVRARMYAHVHITCTPHPHPAPTHSHARNNNNASATNETSTDKNART
jgi:hypothetical protein